MIVFNNAEQMTPAELKEMVEEKTTCPTVDRLLFIETKGKDGRDGGVWPCYLEAWGEDEQANVKADPGLRFQLAINQYAGGEFQMVRVIVLANELGITKRIWDRPPAKMLRDSTPWVALEGAVQ